MDIAAQRLHNQRLVGGRLGAPADAVRWLGAVQSQDIAGAAWAVAQRTTGAGLADVDRAVDAGEIVRTHVLRPTWHFVAPDDVRWMLALSAPRVRAAMAPYDRKLELDDAVFSRTHALIAAALDGGRHLTRAEVGRVLAQGGVAASGQRLGHVMMRAELDALVVSGPRRGRQPTYALLDERVPPAPAVGRDEALARLALRYVRSHGPATPHDLAWWSGQTVTDARAGIDAVRAGLVSEAVGGTVYWQAAPAPARRLDRPVVHLLPNYDEHVVAYKDHGPTLDPALRALPHGDALDLHLVVRDGLVVGGWRRTVAARQATVETELLVDLTGPERDALGAAAEAFGRALGVPVVVRERG